MNFVGHKNKRAQYVSNVSHNKVKVNNNNNKDRKTSALNGIFF